jgi:hypothetical protein
VQKAVGEADRKVYNDVCSESVLLISNYIIHNNRKPSYEVTEMKNDIKKTLLYRKYGLLGLKIFTYIWFPILYLLLASVGIGGLYYYKEFWMVMIIVLLIIAASSLLSKMLCDQIRNIKEIENKEKPA